MAIQHLTLTEALPEGLVSTSEFCCEAYEARPRAKADGIDDLSCAYCEADLMGECESDSPGMLTDFMQFLRRLRIERKLKTGKLTRKENDLLYEDYILAGGDPIRWSYLKDATYDHTPDR